MSEAGRHRRFTLEEVERLLAMANRIGVPVEPWVGQLARELRARQPSAAQEGAELAGRMRSDPGQSLKAQARIDRGTLHMLKS